MKLLTTIITALTATATLAVADPDKKPNLLFILVDDLGAMDLSMTGSKVYDTPNIDALAKDGMTFKNAYSAHPRCLSSRYGIFSGRIPSHDGVPGFPRQKKI